MAASEEADLQQAMCDEELGDGTLGLILDRVEDSSSDNSGTSHIEMVRKAYSGKMTATAPVDLLNAESGDTRDLLSLNGLDDIVGKAQPLPIISKKENDAFSHLPEASN